VSFSRIPKEPFNTGKMKMEVLEDQETDGNTE
jgi:hypothetical protein